jgi:hypothetical protein
MTLGTVNPGERREFVLPDDTQFVYPTDSIYRLSREQRQRVHIRYECRQEF